MTYNALWRRLERQYGEGEAKAIVRLLLDVRFGLSWTDIVCGKADELTAEEQTVLQAMMLRLEQGEPVQYVLEQAEFGPRTFRVRPSVLIPRPETYELCEWITGNSPDVPKGEEGLQILDIGTGSGCIACTLAAELPQASVTAWDISEEALAVARENAKQSGVDVKFERQDALCPPDNDDCWDIIVSNPPYICDKERTAMEQNVLEHEPHTALFVPDEDPLLFYRTIAQYGRQALKPEGWLYFEINPLYANDMQHMLSMLSYRDIELKTDQFGKLRMIRAMKGKR